MKITDNLNCKHENKNIIYSSIAKGNILICRDCNTLRKLPKTYIIECFKIITNEVKNGN